MLIRKATKEDVEVIVEYNYNLAYETENKKLNREILYRGITNLIEDETKGIYYVCVIEGKIVGQIMHTYEWSDWRNGTFIWVQSVYVSKDYRGRGVFKALYNYVKDICDNEKNDFVGIRLYVEKENHRAKKIYKELGMEECNYYMYEYEK